MDRAAEAAGELEPILALLAGAESAASGIREQARQDALELGERPQVPVGRGAQPVRQAEPGGPAVVLPQVAQQPAPG
jgi:hypothetical protein